MKSIIIRISLIIICLLSLSLKGQDTTYKRYDITRFIEVKIRAGTTIFGSSSISLQREGLVCWSTSWLKNPFEKSIFIPFEKLDIKKVFQIINYIYDHELIYINKIPYPENYFSTALPIRISFLIVENKQYETLKYYYCDEHVEQLVQLMNELIPKKHKRTYEIKGKCYE